MLNKNKERELAYVVKIDAIEPIVGSDNCEAAVVGGWRVMVRKNTFFPGDLAVYFEIDSMVDCTRPEFEFLAKRNGKIKTQRYTFGGKGLMISQGLLMAAEDFGWTFEGIGKCAHIFNPVKKIYYYVDDESRFLTQELGVTYAEAEDNARKAEINPNVKYKNMMSRHPKLFSKCFIKYLYKKSWGRKLLFIFLGKKKDNKKSFPTHLEYIHKSDEERCENIPFILEDNDEWVKTTKIDGTSSLYLLERKPFNKFEYWVCSRNVRQLDRKQACYHNDNVYWEVEDKYHIENCLKDILTKNPELKYVAIQGETAGVSSSGAKIQGDPHNFGELRFFAYNFITSDKGRWETTPASKFLVDYHIDWVPIIDEHYYLPKNFEEFKKSADGPCEAIGATGMREGYVYRRAKFKDGMINSFKNVSRNYLLKN